MANEKKNLAREKAKEKKLVKTKTTTTTMARHPLCLRLSSIAPCCSLSLHSLSLNRLVTAAALFSVLVLLMSQLAANEGNVWQQNNKRKNKHNKKTACKRNDAKFKRFNVFRYLFFVTMTNAKGQQQQKMHKEIGK